mgnify:CR=1 FL=1
MSTDPSLTELCAPLFFGWQRASGDPDYDLIRWLFEGAPAGIDKQPGSAGIFPPSAEPPSREFELSLATGDTDYNYISMDDSPYTAEVLGDLVKSGYVVKCRNLVEARR